MGSMVTSGPLILAVPVALAAGAITFMTPCCLPLVPGFIAYVTGMSGSDLQQTAGGQDPRMAARGRAVAGTALFVVGFSALFAIYGTVFGAVGSALATHQQVITRVLGVVTIVLGLLFAGAFDRFPAAGRVVKPSFRPGTGLAAALLLGVMFGLGWTPCVGPTLQAVLALSFTSGAAGRGAFLAFVYSLGLGLPFLIVALGMQRGMRAFGFARRHARLITGIGGGLLVVVGLLEVTGAWATAIIWLKIHWFVGYTAPL